MSHQTGSTTDGTVVVVATSTPATAFPPKPANWAIYPGKMFLVESGTTGSDGNRPATGKQMTQLEISMCEQWAWEDVLVALAGKFDVCDWGIEPPFGLERDWNMLASAYYLQMEHSGTTVDGRVSPVWTAWMSVVREHLAMINASTIVLMDATCKSIYPDPTRAGTLKIGVAGPTTTIFPWNDDEALDQTFVGGSLQELQRLHGRYSVSYGGQFPVSA